MIKRLAGLVLCLCAAGAVRADKPTAERLSFSRYFYGYQADPRKPLPEGDASHLANGASPFAVNPSMGLGPWFGYGHAMWHRDNLMAMRRAGIDVALPVFRADSASLAGYAERGLDSLAQALIELKRDHQDYPLIAMYYDTTSLGTADKPLDVSSDAGKAQFYDGIRRFYRHVPEEFRALIPVSDGLANIVTLGPAAPLAGLDGSLRHYCEARFQADFGRRLLWVGEVSWKSSAGNLDGYADFNGGRSLVTNSSGPLTIATIGPGSNSSGQPDGFIRTRGGGTTMMDDWRTLFQNAPDWIVVETWNDFAGGSAIAGTRTYGVRELDEATAGMLQFRNEAGPVAQALHVNAPDTVMPRSVVPIEVVAQNGSLENWRSGDVLMAASWYQDGKLIDAGPHIPNFQPVPVMGILTAPLSLVAANGDGTPLPEGKYELRVEMFKSGRDATGKIIETPFPAPIASIPLSVGTPSTESARIVTSNASPYLMAGADTPVQVIVRNDGAKAWPKGGTRIGWRIVHAGASDETVANGLSDALLRDIAPGDVTDTATVTIHVPKEAATIAPGGDSEYELQWSVETGGTSIPVNEAPGSPARRPLEVLPLVSIAHFPIGNSVPPTCTAGAEQDVRTVVHNLSPFTWKASDMKVGYHWYYWDGTEALWDSPKVALPHDVKPGDETLVDFPVTIPDIAGPYVLAIDVWDGKEWLSTLPATAGNDTSVAWVNVLGGDLRPMDLTGLFDVDGLATDLNPGGGEFADGLSYPAEQVPPDVQPPLAISSQPVAGYPPGIQPILYPAGYFGAVDTLGASSSRRIPFRYPTKKENEKNFMFCRGQTLPVGRGTYNKLYLLAAATQDTQADFILNYADGAPSTTPLLISKWTDGPKHGEIVGLDCTFRRSAKGDDPSSHAYLYVYELGADPARTLESITFPENRNIRIMAITTDEKPGVVYNPVKK